MNHDLLWYVDRLRKPIRDVVTTGDVRQHTDRPGLLRQLADAVHGSFGSHAGGSAFDRMPFNTDALELYERIESEITDLFVQTTGQVPYLELERNLTGWYVEHSRRFSKGLVSLADDDKALTRVRGWVEAVENFFNPPTRLEVVTVSGGPEACPECGARFGLDPRTGDRSFALSVLYRRSVRGGFEGLRVVCGSCAREWVGGEVDVLFEGLDGAAVEEAS